MNSSGIFRIAGRVLFRALAVAVLTLFTQVGGVLLLACIPLFRLAGRRLKARWQRRLARPAVFFLVYGLFCTLLLPPLARLGGKVPLPVFGAEGLKPLNYWTCIFNRHYVTPEMRETLLTVSEEAAEAHPGTVIAYLDAQFPLFDMSLPPHITHDDGRKADLAFLYRDPETHAPEHRVAPTWIGYGGSEPVAPGEPDRPALCRKRGFWAYGFMARRLPRWFAGDHAFDTERTAFMVRRILAHDRVRRIYLEPHLVQRLGFSGNDKIGVASCRSVRHDDHVHVEVR